MTTIKRYSELITIPTFDERFEYLKLNGIVCEETFGYDRYLNQMLYNSPEWKRFRQQIIIRDNGCDLACEGRKICGAIIIHHLNPITVDDIIDRSIKVFSLENVVCTIDITHRAIHYGDKNLLAKDPLERKPNDTSPWRR